MPSTQNGEIDKAAAKNYLLNQLKMRNKIRLVFHID